LKSSGHALIFSFRDEDIILLLNRTLSANAINILGYAGTP